MDMEYFRKEGAMRITFHPNDLELAMEVVHDVFLDYQRKGHRLHSPKTLFKKAIQSNNPLDIKFDFESMEIGVSVVEAIAEEQEERGDDSTHTRGFVRRIIFFENSYIH